ncbi:ATG2A isoform 2 [Pan troglodytes]|uniref:ATG2A isoform 2 n=1 Tax=Pan troglodytes TaxID=9598 RepID=A0A2J8QCH1_PANTR|nr:ATG2A isoform 2 [Pan troglodytes]
MAVAMVKLCERAGLPLLAAPLLRSLLPRAPQPGPAQPRSVQGQRCPARHPPGNLVCERGAGVDGVTAGAGGRLRGLHRGGRALGCSAHRPLHSARVRPPAHLAAPPGSSARGCRLTELGYALNEWLQDIRKNQLPGLLGGVGPMHSVVQLFQGFRDLLWLPIEQYRKDGRLMRGLQRGAASFGSSTASAALELSNRLVQAIQATAETVYDILSPAAPVSRSLQDKRSARRLRRGQQPADLREGVAKAYDTVREGILDTAQTICDVASRGHEQKGLTGAVGGVIRQLPPTVVKPLILATEATSSLLGGMRNQIVPDAHKDHALKWRSDSAQD